MRRASLLVACFATFCSPVFAQTRPVQDDVLKQETVVERNGSGERDPVSRVIVVSDPVVQTQKTRSLVSRSSSKGQIDFNIPWQTGIYQ